VASTSETTEAAVDVSTAGRQRPAGLRMAMAQISPVLGDRRRNLSKHLEQIEAARRQGDDLIVFPELSLTGYFLRDMVPEVALDTAGPQVRRLAEAAGPTSLVLGMVEESPQHRFFNTALYIEGGRIVHRHRKVYLPTYGLFDEQRYFAAGERIEAFDTARFGRVGILICEDFWHLSAAAIMQAEEVDLLICMGPTRPPGASPGRESTRPRPTSSFARPSPICSARWWSWSTGWASRTDSASGAAAWWWDRTAARSPGARCSTKR